MSKKIWCIRHGVALHNHLYKLIGTKAYTDKIYQDTPLIEEGEIESKKLGYTWKDAKNIEIVFVSPLTRTLETAKNIFSNHNKKIIAIEEIIEYEQANEYCNKRKKKSELVAKYPEIDFSLISEQPKYWKEDGNETLFELRDRCDTFKKYLSNRPEKNICIVSHSTFLKQFMHENVGLITEELKYCYPFTYNLQVTNNTFQEMHSL